MDEDTLAAALIELAPIVEAVIGHRNALVAAGFDPDTANDMATTYHDALIATVFGCDECEEETS